MPVDIFSLSYEEAKNFVERYRNRSATPENLSKSNSPKRSKHKKSKKRKTHKHKKGKIEKSEKRSKLTKSQSPTDVFMLEKGAKKLMNEIKSIEGAFLNSPANPILQDEKGLKELEEKIKEAQQEALESMRDDLTVLVHNIPIKASESEIYRFFSTASTGKIRDIRIIKDPKSGKSKGAAYVEFYTPESVLKALGLSGVDHKDWNLKIYPSQAEKNRAHAANKTLKSTNSEISLLIAPPALIYFDGIYEELKPMTEEDMKYLFSSFGEIQNVLIERDDEGAPLGFGTIQFKTLKEARRAVDFMNGFYVNSQRFSVSLQPLTAKQAEKVKIHIDFDGEGISNKPSSNKAQGFI